MRAKCMWNGQNVAQHWKKKITAFWLESQTTASLPYLSLLFQSNQKTKETPKSETHTSVCANTTQTFGLRPVCSLLLAASPLTPPCLLKPALLVTMLATVQ
ncbi:hypothetical protein Ancab_034035 [Ancistrocladus abbreviatus]